MNDTSTPFKTINNILIFSHQPLYSRKKFYSHIYISIVLC